MATDSNALQDLRPLVMPSIEDVSPWPLAPGWWILLVLVVFLIIFAIFFMRRQQKKNRIRKIRQTAINQVQDAWQHYLKQGKHNELVSVFIVTCKQIRLLECQQNSDFLAMKSPAFFRQMREQYPLFFEQCAEIDLILAQVYSADKTVSDEVLENFRNAIIDWINHPDLRLDPDKDNWTGAR